MSDRDKIIETMADGIRDAIDAEGLVRPEAAASAALTALKASGRAVVPVEPSEAMLDHGGSSIIRPSIYMGGTPPGAKRRARDVWAAMLAAHTQEKDA